MIATKLLDHLSLAFDHDLMLGCVPLSRKQRSRSIMNFDERATMGVDREFLRSVRDYDLILQS